MNLSISHDSEVEAFAFPFLFLEVSPALDAINGYGKTKSNAFTTPNLKCLLVLEQKKKEESRRRRNEEEGDGGVFGQRGGEVVFRLCENEGLKKGIYRREGVKGSAMIGGFGRESGLNLKGEVGGEL